MPLNADVLSSVCLIATDMDGTLTRHGKFSTTLLTTLERLAAANIPVVIVTGRSAGWVNGVVAYLPVAGAIAENGGVFYPGDVEPTLLVPIGSIADHRQKLAQMFQRLQQDFPFLQEAADNRFRLTDWTFDVHGLSPDALQQMRDRCEEHGWGFTYSTVQCHIKPYEQDKATALSVVLNQHYPTLTYEQVVTVGDSPNDESLFEGDRFPLSVGVANILHYTERLTHRPAYVTNQAEVDGFCELAQMLLSQGDRQES